MNKTDKLILEALRYLLVEHPPNNRIGITEQKRLGKEIDELLNPSKSDFPEIKKTIEDS